MLATLEDHLSSLTAILGTQFVEFIKGDVVIWEQKLTLISDVIEEWLSVQRNWQYLENIFGTAEI